jgi:hypothetical protein
MKLSRFRIYLKRLILRERLILRASAESENSHTVPIWEGSQVVMAYRGGQQIAIPSPPPRCPEGWEIGPPTFVGIGVQKAGTSWWHRNIASHPEVSALSRKEVQYFEHGWNVEVDEQYIVEYHKYFPRHEGIVTGEWSPRYMLDPWTAERLHKVAPEARLLVLLRDPMEVLVSGMRMAMKNFESPHPRVLTECIERGRFAKQLNRVARYYERTQILVLQFERCVQSPEAEYARTLEFIGVDSSFVPTDLRKPENQGRYPKLTLPSDIMDLALETYRADVAQLRSDWPEIDLDLWKRSLQQRTVT